MPIPCPFTLPPGATAYSQDMHGGVQWIILDASSRYLASVVRHSGSYGREKGLWEVAALSMDSHIDYTTQAVGGDVLGWKNADQVGVVLAALMQERIAKTMGVACAADHVLAQWERDHAAVTAWMDGQP